MYDTSYFGNMVFASVIGNKTPTSHDITLPLWEDCQGPPNHPMVNSGIMPPMTEEWGVSRVGLKCY
jgi:hypothetical protein